MLAFGALLTCAAVLALAALVVVLRGPNPPPWATRHWAQELVTLVIVFGLAFGLGYLGAGVIRAYEAGPSAVNIVLLGVVLFVAVWIWRRLDPRGRLRALQARPGPAAPGPVPTAGTSVETMHGSDAQLASTEPPSLRPSKPTRRAA